MKASTAGERSLGNWVLTVMFAIAALSSAVYAWQVIRLEGLSVRSIIWMLAVAGFVSLTWRTARAAIRAKADAAPR